MNKIKNFIGVDVSKNTLDLYHSEKGYLQVENNLAGFKKALEHFGLSSIYVMEATGSYHQQFAVYLNSKSASLSVVNPLSVKRFIQMELCRNKTDKSDAKMIANYGASEKPKLWNPPSAYVEMCQAIQGVILKYFREKTSFKNKLHSLQSKGIKKGVVIQSLKLSIKQVSKQISKLEQEIERLIKENKPKLLSNLQSIPGVGRKTAMLLISSTNGFKDFDTHKQVIAYLGLAPMEYSSGTSVKKQSRISKTGHPQVRNHLFMCAFTACEHNAQCKALYDRIVGKGKSKKLALIAVCNKLIKQSFAISKSGHTYDANYRSMTPIH